MCLLLEVLKNDEPWWKIAFILACSCVHWRFFGWCLTVHWPWFLCWLLTTQVIQYLFGFSVHFRVSYPQGLSGHAQQKRRHLLLNLIFQETVSMATLSLPIIPQDRTASVKALSSEVYQITIRMLGQVTGLQWICFVLWSGCQVTLLVVEALHQVLWWWEGTAHLLEKQLTGVWPSPSGPQTLRVPGWLPPRETARGGHLVQPHPGPHRSRVLTHQEEHHQQEETRVLDKSWDPSGSSSAQMPVTAVRSLLLLPPTAWHFLLGLWVPEWKWTHRTHFQKFRSGQGGVSQLWRGQQVRSWHYLERKREPPHPWMQPANFQPSRIHLQLSFLTLHHQQNQAILMT